MDILMNYPRSFPAVRLYFLIGMICINIIPSELPNARSEQIEPMPIPSPKGLKTAGQEGEQLSRHGDHLLKEGREWEAAQSYLAAHEKFQQMLLGYFEQALRADLGGTPADEAALTEASSEVAGLRNINLSKLWIVLDPDDRAFEQGLEADRAALLSRFDVFRDPVSAEPLEQFLNRLYPDDPSGDRQMDALRQGALPPSKRWARLGIDSTTVPLK
jgi:hypothetical protein